MSMEPPSLSAVVRKGSGPDTPLVPEAFPFEPAFSALREDSLTPLVAPAHRADTLTHLGYRVQRMPRDLRAHVRRALLAHESRDASAVCAALVDLFCVLDDKGQDLRRTLVHRVADVLTDGQRAAIDEMMGRRPTSAERDATPGARLSPPAPEAPVVLRHEPREEVLAFDPFELPETNGGSHAA